MRRSGERRKRGKERKRRISRDQTSFWASLGSIGTDEKEASDILDEKEEAREIFDNEETRIHSSRRRANKEHYNKHRHVNRARNENDENFEEESRSGMKARSKYQNSNLMKLLQLLSTENKVNFTII